MRAIKATLLILVAGFAALASVTGPEARFTGAPGDLNSCVQCHDTFERADVGEGNVRISGHPAVYQPGVQYDLNITVQHPGRTRFGYQLTAIDEGGDRIGTLSPLSTDSQINSGTGPGDRQYIQHTQFGTTASIPGTRTWQVRWTAPSSDQGAVRFFVAGNATNSDGTNQGDFVYTAAATSESPSTTVAVTFDSRPDGLVLAPGSKHLINWTTTNSSNVESYEIRYSTNDGMTYPISNLILSTTDSTLTSFEWTLPEVATTQARMRVQAIKRSGSASEAISGRFTIGEGSGSARPVITAARINGKGLFVSGSGFQPGAVVELDRQEQKTINRGDFEHELKCRKSGKRIQTGISVSLIVKNPDGKRSDGFAFTRAD